MKRRNFLASAGAAVSAAVFPAHSAAAGPDGKRNKSLPDAREGSLKGLPDPQSPPRRVLAGLEPYVPSPAQPWDARRVEYLLRRTTFGAKRSHVADALAKSPGETIDLLLADLPLPDPPFAWHTENWTYDQTVDAGRFQQLYSWWFSLMLADAMSFREKMTLFWHDHFATEWNKVQVPQFNYGINRLCRKNAFGNFKTFVRDITVDPCMLFYLDGQYSSGSNPNENFGRELQELFTLGIYDAAGNPNYTEADIENAARALTGWTVRNVGTPSAPVFETSSVFVPARHDTKDKIFHGSAVAGKTGADGAQETDRIVDILFQQAALAEFICRKIYREFVYEIADETIVRQMADLFRQGNFEIKPVLATLFKSAHFFDDANIGSHIMNPCEFTVGACRSLDLAPSAPADLNYLYSASASLGMQIFDPPNVKGWPGYRSWISSSLLPSRWGYTDSIVDGTKTAAKFDPKAYAATFPNPSDAEALVRDLTAHLITVPLSDNQINILIDKLMLGAPAYEWPNVWASNDPSIPNRLKGLLKAILRLGENQLC